MKDKTENMKKCCSEANANTYYNVCVWLNERAEAGDKKAKDFLDKSKQKDDFDIEEVIKWMIELAENGDVDAQYNLGLHYKQTPGIRDKEKAIEWFTKAAENGCLNSCWNLGMYYEYGIDNVEKSIDEAIKWYEKIANSDNDLRSDAKEKLKKLKNR